MHASASFAAGGLPPPKRAKVKVVALNADPAACSGLGAPGVSSLVLSAVRCLPCRVPARCCCFPHITTVLGHGHAMNPCLSQSIAEHGYPWGKYYRQIHFAYRQIQYRGQIQFRARGSEGAVGP